MALKKLLAAAVGGFAFAAAAIGGAQASDLYQFDRTGSGGGAGGSLIEFFELVYTDDGSTQRLRATLDFKPEIVQGGREGGFWLVVSDGPNPKNQIGEYAILYGDLNNGRITAYEYNGDNNASSFSDPGNLLQIFNNALVFDDFNGADGIVEFDIDVTSINAAPLGPDWDGVSFGEKIGVWFHFGENLFAEYRNNGKLKKFNLHPEGWVDFANKHSKDCTDLPPDFPGCRPPEVSEPASLALLGLGLAGLAVTRRRRA